VCPPPLLMGQEWCLVPPLYWLPVISLLPLEATVQLLLMAPKALAHTSPDFRLLDPYRLYILFPRKQD